MGLGIAWQQYIYSMHNGLGCVPCDRREVDNHEFVIMINTALQGVGGFTEERLPDNGGNELQDVHELGFAFELAAPVGQQFEDAQADGKARGLQSSLQLADGIHAILVVLHHFRKQIGEGTETDRRLDGGSGRKRIGTGKRTTVDSQIDLSANVTLVSSTRSSRHPPGVLAQGTIKDIHAAAHGAEGWCATCLGSRLTVTVVVVVAPILFVGT